MARLSARGLAAALALLAASVAGAGINSWTTTGPQGGNFADLERSSTAPNTLYATAGRGFFRSTDGGRTWNAGYRLPGQTADIAVDPVNGQRVYVGVVTGPGGVFRSEDGGQTFTQVATLWQGAWGVSAGGPDGATVYYSAQNEFARSTDRGATWTVRSTGFNVATQLYVDRNNPDILTANFQLNIGLSTDGGQTWSLIPSPAGGFINYLYRVSPTELLASSASGLHRSINNGASWTWVAFGTITGISTNPANPAEMIAGSAFASAPYHSIDGGATWQVVTGAPPTFYIKRMVYGAGGRLAGGSDEGIFVSSNGGASWAAAPRGPVASIPGIVAAGATRDSPIYVSTGPYGFYASYDDGPWTPRYGPASFSGTVDLAVKPDTPRTLLMSPAQLGIRRSVDGGTTWTDVGGFSGFDAKLAFGRHDPNRVYALIVSWYPTRTSRVFTSADGGLTWTQVTTDLPAALDVGRLVVDPGNDSRLFVAARAGFSPGPAGGLYRSVDGGAHWTNTNVSDHNVWGVAVDPDDASFVYATTTAGFFTSVDGGTTFAHNDAFSAISPFEGGAVAIDPEVTSTVYASSLDSGYFSSVQRPSIIVRSVDRGASWEILRASTAQPEYLTNVLLLDPAEPTRLHASTGSHGLASFEIRNDLAVVITGHAGDRKVGVATGYQARITNNGPYHATRVQASLRVPSGATNVRWSAPVGGFCGRHGNKVDCEIAVVRTGASPVIGLTYTPTQIGALAVRVDVDAHEHDLDDANNTATASANAVP